MKLDVTVNLHNHTHDHDANVVDKRFTEISVALQILNRKLDQIMTDLSKLQAAVEKQTTVTQSAITLIQGLAEAIRNLPADQARINELADTVDAQAQAMSDAVAANTPPSP